MLRAMRSHLARPPSVLGALSVAALIGAACGGSTSVVTADVSAAPPSSAAPAGSATSEASSAPAASAARPKAARIEYAPPSPFNVAVTAPKDATFTLHPTKGALVVPVIVDEKLRTILVVAGGVVKEAPELAKGLSAPPTQIVGTYPDALFASADESVYAWSKGAWVVLSAKGPFDIARWESGVVAQRVGAPALALEVFGLPGSTARPQPSTPPDRPNKCPLEGPRIAGTGAGDLVVFGSGCQGTRVETWSPTTKTWTNTFFDDIVFYGQALVSPQGDNAIFLTSMGMAAGEPFMGAFTLQLDKGTWKKASTAWVTATEAELFPVLKPFDAEPVEGEHYAARARNPVTFEGHVYAGGAVLHGDEPMGAVLVVDSPVKSVVAL